MDFPVVFSYIVTHKAPLFGLSLIFHLKFIPKINFNRNSFQFIPVSIAEQTYIWDFIVRDFPILGLFSPRVFIWLHIHDELIL